MKWWMAVWMMAVVPWVALAVGKPPATAPARDPRQKGGAAMENVKITPEARKVLEEVEGRYYREKTIEVRATETCISDMKRIKQTVTWSVTGQFAADNMYRLETGEKKWITEIDGRTSERTTADRVLLVSDGKTATAVALSTQTIVQDSVPEQPLRVIPPSMSGLLGCLPISLAVFKDRTVCLGPVDTIEVEEAIENGPIVILLRGPNAETRISIDSKSRLITGVKRKDRTGIRSLEIAETHFDQQLDRKLFELEVPPDAKPLSK